MAGLAPQNLRIVGPEQTGDPDLPEIIVQMEDEGGDQPEFDDSGAIMRIEHDDGSVTISLDGRPLDGPGHNSGNIGWFDNLVEHLEQADVNKICQDLLRGITEDIESRRDWIEARAKGIALLGLKIETPNVSGASESAPVEGMSLVRHPLLLEAVLRFQANASGELLPADGPVKIRNDDTAADMQEDAQANALQMDMNHYVTAVAKEYYPDTDRMLLMLGFGGTSFKKGYKCPLRRRPVLESVDADDLIVNNATTDLSNAQRITHRTHLKPSTVRRLQILGVYRDIDLGAALAPSNDAVQLAKKDQQGVRASANRPEDNDREIYECYCELDIPGFEHKYKGKPSGLEIPYRVTIDVSSQTILSIVRNYNEPESDDELPVARRVFVKYTFVPGLGFYDIGLLNILGNTTNAITAAWRELLDAGMYSNFPGFLMADTGARQQTNIFRVPPGGGALVKTGGMKISEAIMPLPYQQPSVALMSLVGDIAQTGMRVGGTSEQQVGEGRADAPVGTTLALIEQAVKVMNAVHKRLHAAQAEELDMLKELFREDPQAFINMKKCRSKTKWTDTSFLEALDNCDLVPRADPNTSSQAQRMMKFAALKELQKANPTLYDPIAIDTAAIQAIGFSNPQQFMAPPAAQANPPPEMLKMQADAKVAQQKADAVTMDAQTKAQELQIKAQAGFFNPKPAALGGAAPEQDPMEMQLKLQDAQTRRLDAETRAHQVPIKHAEMQMEDQNRDLDRQSREQVQVMELARDIILHPDAEEREADDERKHKHALELAKKTAALKPRPRGGKKNGPS